jgi:membrane protease YdiL (CAAX protease family)
MSQDLRPRRSSLTIAHANGVLLASIVAILGGGLAMAAWSTYRVLALRELVFILLPACLVTLLLKQPSQEKARLLRLRWPGGRIAALSVLIGAGGWLVDSWLGVVLTEGLGYVAPLPPDFFPTTPGKGLALLVVLAFLAPICEETLFRGVIQRGYEELSPRAAILAGGALFALFHQSLPQGLALLPLAFVLGYLVWRSDSLFAGIIAHATNNALAGALIIAATADPEIAPWIGTLPTALAGAALASFGLWGLRRWTAPPVEAASPQARAAAGTISVNRDIRFWAVRLWPLLLVLPIVAFSVGLEALMGRFPDLLSQGRPVRWSFPPWDTPQAWTYEIRNTQAIAKEPVGRAQCTLSLQNDAYLLKCSRQQSAYEADTGSGVYWGRDVDEQFTARWQRPGLRLSSVERRTQVVDTDGKSRSFEAAVVQGQDAVEVVSRWEGNVQQEASFPLAPFSSPQWPDRTLHPVVLEASEWPWRLSALPFGVFYSAEAILVDPEAFAPYDEEKGPGANPTHVVVYGAEPVKTPAGTFIAWHVRLGDDLTAWYDVERPHTLVTMDNGTETWVLTSIE